MKDDKLYLGHIRDAIAAIEEYIGNSSYEQFCKNRMMVDAVIYQLEILGEATNRLSNEFAEANPEIPFRDIIDTRNVLIHDYMGVNTKIVWDTCKDDLPSLKSLITTAMKKDT